VIGLGPHRCGGPAREGPTRTLEIAFQGVTKHWQLLMGGFIVLVALFLPGGLIGLASAWQRRREGGE
jgi:ABC-type branched-subunit amino acid transport system permease subunit